MVRTNPREAGDDIYEQYTIKKTYELASATAATKGNIYKFNDDGRLIVLTASSGAVDLVKGAVQATAAVTAQTYSSGSGPTVQCHVGGSWVILKAAAANMTPQTKVVVSGSGSTVAPQKVAALGTSTTSAYILGKIHEILAADSNGNTKLKTAVDDLVVVQLGVV